MSKAFGAAATAKAVLLVTGSNYVSLVLGLLTNAIIARELGPKDFGSYSYIMWISATLTVVANNGLTTTGLRFVSESLGRENARTASDVHGWLLRAQHVALLLTALGFVMTAQLTLPIDWSMPVSIFIVAVLVSLVAKTYGMVQASVAKGHGHYIVDVGSAVVTSAFSLVVVLGLYLMDAPLLAYLAMFAVSNIVYLVTSHWMTRTRGIAATTDPLDSELGARVRSHLVWTIVMTVTAAFGNKASETFLLGKYVGIADVGFFAIAAALSRGAVDMLAAGLNNVLMPIMAHGFGQGGVARVHAILGHSVRFFTFGGFLLAGVGFMWADVVVTLVYGSQYQVAADVLRVMVVVAGLTLSLSAFGALLSTTDNQRVRAYVAIASVLVSVAVAVVLVPRYGLQGAVLSYALSSIVIFLAVCVGIVKMLHVKLPWRELSRLLLAACLAALVSGPILWCGQGLVLQFVAGSLFAVVYLVATVLFRAWREEDLSQLQPLANRYPRLGRALPRLARWAGH